MSAEAKTGFDPASYWNKRYEHVDLVRSGHMDLPAEYNIWLYARKQKRLVEVLAKLGFSLFKSKLLEVASGSGAYLDFWKQEGVGEYLGIDLSDIAIQSLKQRYPKHQFLQYDLNTSGLPNAVGVGYDIATALDVLYHVVDDERFNHALIELAMVLKPGGLLVIHDQFIHRSTSDHGYIKWRSLMDYEKALQAAGFEIITRRPIFFFMIQTIDFKGWAQKTMDTLWDRFTYPFVQRFPKLAGALGNTIDNVICKFVNEGPTMEIMVCRKKG